MTPSGARPAVGAVCLAVLGAACAHAPPPAPAPAPPAATSGGAPPRAQPPERPPAAAPSRGHRRVEVGVASYYAHRFHGRRTASGARYDMHALTCAHPTLPFGTRLRVTELESGRSVVVTVTDRGPFSGGRIVDVSLAAAKQLGMLDRGLARVRVERL